MRSIFAAPSENLASQGADNARKEAQIAASNFQKTFTEDVLFNYNTTFRSGFSLNYSGWHDQSDILSISKELNNHNTDYTRTITHGLWPAYHAEFINALADELDAVEYRTITPTCAETFMSGNPMAYVEPFVETMFLLPNGANAYLKYKYSTNYDDLDNPKEYHRNLKKNIKYQNKRGGLFATIKYDLIGTPLYPEINHTYIAGRGMTMDKRVQLMADLSGQTSEQLLETYALSKKITKWRSERWAYCHDAHKSETTAPHEGLILCLWGPPMQERWQNSQSNPMDYLQDQFRTFVQDDKMTYGLEILFYSYLRRQESLARNAEMMARDRAEARAERRATWSAIFSGVGDGFQSVARSTTQENARAAYGQQMIFSGQYGCSAGGCASGTSTASETYSKNNETTGKSEGEASAASQSGANEASKAQGKPTHIVKRSNSNTAIYKDGHPNKSDTQLCEGLTPRQGRMSSGLGRILVETASPCSCEDRNMGRKVRMCTVTFDAEETIPSRPGDGSER